MEIERLKIELANLDSYSREVRNRLSKRYSSTLDKSDPRIAVARHIRAAITVAYLNSIFLDEYLNKKSWGQANFSGFPEIEYLDMINDYDTGLTLSFTTQPFFAFEAGLRRVGRALGIPYMRFSELFPKIVDELSLSDDKNAEVKKYFQLHNEVRNMIHNNGYYFPPSGKDRVINYKKVDHHFDVGKASSFIDWDFNLAIVRDLIDVNATIMESNTVSKLPEMSDLV